MTKKRKKRPIPKRLRTGRQKVERQDIHIDELTAIVERTTKAALGDDDHGKLKAAVDTLVFMTQELERKGASIRRLRQMLFGASTEKTANLFGQTSDDPGSKAGESPPAGAATGKDGDGDRQDSGDAQSGKRRKRKGHGRNSAADYTGADKVKLPHESLQPGDHCPKCLKGKVYRLAEPAVMVRVQGMAPLSATVYERERLRCNLCGEVFTALAPDGVGEDKYDETSAAMVGLLKYGCGLPFNRLERLQRGLGIPLPASTQWDIVNEAAGKFEAAYAELIRQAAQGKVLHNDDTTVKILELMGVNKPDKPSDDDDDDSDERTGMFTTGIVATTDDHKIALFFSGRQHAGENLADVLAQRASELAPPIQMCDGLSRNKPGDFETLMANCLTHGRRKFVEVAENFPDECLHVLETLRDVYRNDAHTREQKMTADERLAYHKAHSRALMDELECWLQAQLDEHRIEPNSGLGDAIKYVIKRWDKLTLFLRVPGAPLDNNIAERILKKAILHRKNAYFYKTMKGARVGDAFMSFIHTAELCGANPFDYLVALLRHSDAVAQNPGQWMPWNFTDALSALAVDHAPTP
ncbi:MAG: IS66 family transposase [Deltaproteobacteria bacterium]|nr:IS66 family transposase [Deltaproteobacteria bacterium]